MHFLALELSIHIIEKLRPLVRTLRTHDRKLTAQITTAASSTSLNIAEGSRRRGQDRRQHYRIASGSNEEVRTALRVAVAWGYLEKRRTAEVLSGIDRLQRILWGSSE